MVLGIALIAVVVAAPMHAVYRNNYAYEEGRSFYRSAAQELTRQWHEYANVPLPAVSGDDALAFATAFYSPDHPMYARPFAYQYTWGLPRQTTLKRGWAALCFEGNAPCIEWMQKTSARAVKFVNPQFVVQSTLLGMPGASRRIIALIVPPSEDDTITPPTGSREPGSESSLRVPKTGLRELR